jgi:hypothetical protein
MLKSLCSSRKFLVSASSDSCKLTQYFYTTKERTKDTKVSTIILVNFVLFVAFVVRFPVSFLVAALPR